MAPTLYMIPASPPVRAVLLCAKALGLDLELKKVDLFAGEHLKPEFLKMNPTHTVPVLVDVDGFTLSDSHAILPYLIGKYGADKSLYPEDLQKRAVIDQRLHFDSNVLFARGLLISKGILLGGKKEVEPELKQSLKEAFDIVEKFLEKNTYIAGEELSIADFTYVTTITSWTYFVSIEGTTYPRIQTWLKRMESLPYYAEANKPGLEEFRGLLHSRNIPPA